MLKIKLSRFGKRHQPHFRFVVTEARSRRDGQYVVSLGHYAPTAQPKLLQLDLALYDAWLKKGAQPTETVAALAAKVRDNTPFAKKKTLSKKAVAKQKQANETKEEAKAAPTPEESKPAESVEKPVEATAEVAPEAAKEEKTQAAA